MAGSDILGLSDEEILNANSIEDIKLNTKEPEDTTETEGDKTPSEVVSEGETQEQAQDPEEALNETEKPAETETENSGTTEPEVKDPSQGASKEASEKEQEKEDNSSIGSKDTNYEEFYKKVTAPFKANGKTIELRSPDEAIKLMQMGANYTRKLQELAPHRKVLTMLQNNNIDEERLSFLIDLDKKNPDAIKELLKSSGFDPLDFDPKAESNYHPNNHRVSDNEVRFRTAVEEVISTDTGKETIAIINNTWDQVSKETLWREPQLLSIIQSQRENGVYETITNEIERQRVLGNISADTPFLEAYKLVGDEIFKPASQGNTGVNPTTPNNKVLAVKPATVNKSSVANGDKARAASPTKVSTSKKETFINPLAMSDDEFIKQTQNRW